MSAQALFRAITVYGLCALGRDQLKFCLTVVCVRSLRPGLTVARLSPVLLCQTVHSAAIPQRCSSRLCTVTVYIASGMMASGDARGSRPENDLSGVHFCNKLQISWNVQMSFVDLESLGVEKLDTSVVPYVLGLKAFYDDAEPVRVLPSRAENVVRVLVLDTRVEPRGFHIISLEDIYDHFGLHPCCQQYRSAGSVNAGLVACNQARVRIVGGTS